MSYYVKALVIDDIIEKVGYGTWKIKKEIDQNYKPKTSSKINHRVLPTSSNFNATKYHTIRGHAFMFSFKIKVVNWLNREKFLNRKTIKTKLPVTPLKNGFKVYGQKTFYNNHKVWFTDDKIIIFLSKEHSFFGESANDCKELAIKEALKVIHGLENIFETSFKFNNVYTYLINKQHYSEINNELAEDLNEKKEKLSIKGSDDKEWLLIDNSHNLNELEAVHPKISDKDMDDVIKPFFNDLRKNPVTTIEILNLVNNNSEHIKDISAGLLSLIKILKPDMLEEKQDDDEKPKRFDYIS